MSSDEPKFALYVSSVPGRLVSRYGAGTRGAPSYIGARRVARDPSSIAWDTELVVALTTTEVTRFAREYERALDAKALRKRTREDWLAQAARERAPAAPPAATPATAAGAEEDRPPPEPPTATLTATATPAEPTPAAKP